MGQHETHRQEVAVAVVALSHDRNPAVTHVQSANRNSGTTTVAEVSFSTCVENIPWNSRQRRKKGKFPHQSRQLHFPVHSATKHIWRDENCTVIWPNIILRATWPKLRREQSRSPSNLTRSESPSVVRTVKWYSDPPLH
jgi:hypothetical protein